VHDPDGSAFGLSPGPASDEPRLPVTGVVLAGGQSRRMGTDKALLTFLGEPLVRRVASTLAEVCNEVMVVATDAAALADVALPPGTRVLGDEVAFQGPLGGLATALGVACNEWVFACGVDMPFLCADVVRLLWGELTKADGGGTNGHIRMVIPVGDAGPEPLLALYRTDCLDVVRRALAEGAHKVVDLAEHLDVLAVPVERLRAVDPELRTLVNVNTAEDLAGARSIASEEMR
jgi:molybdopterin-guanine dinucleotide biosynthesis protein A